MLANFNGNTRTRMFENYYETSILIALSGPQIIGSFNEK